MQLRTDLRNVAIIAHVDHGKTTLVDAMLRQAGAYGARGETTERVMDSGTWNGRRASPSWPRTPACVTCRRTAPTRSPSTSSTPLVTLTSVARWSAASPWSTGWCSWSTRARALPQTRFVLRKALRARMPIILVINKVDRPDARIKEVVDDTYELFLDLDADEEQIDFPIVYACARDGIASLTQPADGSVPDDSTSSSHCSAPCWTPSPPPRTRTTRRCRRT
ncbi:hypothetical protein GCM10027614_24460 [Micromonospora vulcania]